MGVEYWLVHGRNEFTFPPELTYTCRTENIASFSVNGFKVKRYEEGPTRCCAFFLLSCCSAKIAKFVNESLSRIYMGLLFNEDHTAVTGVDDKSISEVIIPQGVVFIEKNAFKDCNLLSSIDLPSSLERIADFAFMGC